MTCGTPPEPIAVFPAVHPEVGDVSIWDDGDEATVAIGDITHGHFGAYDGALSQEQIHEEVAKQVVAFLADLFADKVVLWRTPGRRLGGWYYADREPQGAGTTGCLGRFLASPRKAERFLWSGPSD